MTAVGRAKQRGVFHTGVACIRIAQRRFEMPDAFELPRMRRAVVPEMFADLALVNKLITLPLGHAFGSGCHPAAGRFPRVTAVVGTLDDLAEPAAGLRW